MGANENMDDVFKKVKNKLRSIHTVDKVSSHVLMTKRENPSWGNLPTPI